MLAPLCFIAFGLPVLGAAFLLATGCWRQRHVGEFLGLSIILGQGLGALLAFWASLAGVTPGRWGVGIVAAAGLVVWRWRERWPRGGGAWLAARRDPVCLLAIVVSLAAVATIAADVLAQSAHAWDAFAIWGLKAKAVTAAPVLANGYFQDLSLSYSHLDYPLLVPFLMSLPASAAGTAEPGGMGLVFPFQAIGLALCLHALIRERLGDRLAYLLTAFLLTLPTMLKWGGAMMADFTFGIFFLVSSAYLWRWLETADRKHLAIGCLAGACLLFTKNEGLAASAVIVTGVAAALLIRRQPRRLARLTLGIGMWGLASLPWLWFRAGLPRTHEQYESRLRLASVHDGLLRLPEILAGFGRELLTVTHWGAAVAIVALILWMGRRAWRTWLVVSPLTIVLGQATVYLVVLMVSPWHLSGLLAFVMDRLLLHLAPLAVYCAASCMADADRCTDD